MQYNLIALFYLRTDARPNFDFHYTLLFMVHAFRFARHVLIAYNVEYINGNQNLREKKDIKHFYGCQRKISGAILWNRNTVINVWINVINSNRQRTQNLINYGQLAILSYWFNICYVLISSLIHTSCRTSRAYWKIIRNSAKIEFAICKWNQFSIVSISSRLTKS